MAKTKAIQKTVQPDVTTSTILSLHREIKNRRISCSDCQKLSRDILRILETFLHEAGIKVETDAPPPTVEHAVHENATVQIFRNVTSDPPMPGAGQGREVAPGVVVYEKAPGEVGAVAPKHG